MPKSLLRYPGGKSRAVKHLLPYFPAGVDFVLSPFLGGASVELALCDRGIKVYGYDAFQPLITFWSRLQMEALTLAEEVAAFYPLPKEFFYDLQVRHENTAEYHQSVLFYVLNRSSFDGTTLSGGCSKPGARFNEKSIQRLRDWKFLPNFLPLHGTFATSLNAHPDAFVFADPPYLIKSQLYGDRGDLHRGFDHQHLFQMLREREGWILCYNDCPEIREMYGDYDLVTPEWSYGMGKQKQSRELLILNL
jgi:DNA adenine methylase